VEDLEVGQGLAVDEGAGEDFARELCHGDGVLAGGRCGGVEGWRGNLIRDVGAPNVQ
jgi:hypothetical protein